MVILIQKIIGLSLVVLGGLVFYFFLMPCEIIKNIKTITFILGSDNIPGSIWYTLIDENRLRIKFLFLFIIFIILCSIPSITSVKQSSNVVNDYEESIDTDNNIYKTKGHGLGGLRGGIVFSFEDTQGYGYTHEEIMMNIRIGLVKTW